MTGRILLMSLACAATAAAQPSEAPKTADMNPATPIDNPFMAPFTGVHGTAPFSRITNAHYMPAVDAGIAKARAEMEAIAANPEAPTFQNTIVAMEQAGQDLERVLLIFLNMAEANADDEMMDLSMKASGKLSDYSTWLVLNQPLWQRVKAVWDGRDSIQGLTPEDQTLLRDTYLNFADGGATLEGDDREAYRRIKAELSELTTRFGQNVLKELAGCEIWLESPRDLTGLPKNLMDAAAQAAKEHPTPKGQWLLHLDQPTYMAFMKNSARRDLRQKAWMMYNSRNRQGQYSNKEVMTRIADLRRQLANILGSDTYADYALKRTMAKTPKAVYGLLDQLRDAYRPALDTEMAELTAFAKDYSKGQVEKVMPWDYSFYADKLKKAKYAFDEEKMRPYFPLDSVIQGVFGLATRLYGLQFTPNPEIETYHPDVQAFDVNDADGRFMGVLYTDFFPRASKRPGAWMTNFRNQSKEADGTDVRPQVSLVMNFTKPTADAPALLTPYEVETFLHEFGHSLQGLLADTRYGELSGTSVYRDYVELPSQFNENYLTQPEFLNGFARHYQTGEPMPQDLIDQFIASQRYGAAYACLRQLGFGYDDMAWHTITAPVADPDAFEETATAGVAVFEPVPGTGFSPTFSHIFSGGYAAGYYSYKWAEVLDADAFGLFLERGIFDPATAKAFRDNILTPGGTEDPAVLYRRFRGQDPTIDALLVRDGIKKPANAAR